MSSITINGDTSGSVILQAPAVAGSTTLTLPTSNGTVVSSNSTGGISYTGGGSIIFPASGTVTIPAGTGNAAIQGVSTNIVQGTSQATTSGSSFLFTGIPSYAKRVIILFNGVGQSTSVNGLVQIGSGSITSTGYISSAISSQSAASSSGGSTSTAGYIIWDAYNNSPFTGQVVLTNFSGNIWISSGLLVNQSDSRGATSSGTVTLSGALDRVNITGVTTPTFNAGSINILYE